VRRFSVTPGIHDETVELRLSALGLFTYLLLLYLNNIILMLWILPSATYEHSQSSRSLALFFRSPHSPINYVLPLFRRGGTVQINGVLVGTTPYEQNIPGGYLHKTKTALGARLGYPMIARLTLKGYAAKEIQLTEGPMSWVSTLKGHNHGAYWLLKTDNFRVELQSASRIFTGAVESVSGSTVVSAPRPELSLEELVSRTKPAVVFLKSLTKSGTGFFITATGIVATNAHLARGEEALLATLPNGTQLEAKIVYVDPDLDIALAKTPGEGFPHLPLAEAATVRQGESVLAIGNPGDAMLFSVTKGIVSAVGRFDAAGPGPGAGQPLTAPSLRLPGDGLAGYDCWLRRSDLVLTIRLARIGKKKKPFYRVVVIERTRPRNGRVKELVGTYDPLKKPAEIKLDSERIKYWLGVGAQPSDTVRSFLKLQKIA
jgi:ribosomal protein S16